MALTSGTRLGPYEILAAIGAGGMGEVYRARDTKLNRDVAIKVLPDAVSADPERLARFHREAQVLASLNHPNIAHIYDAGSADLRRSVLDTREHDGASASGVGVGPPASYLVMELVEGPTLADRIAGSGLSALDSGHAASPKAQSLETKAKSTALPLAEALAIAKQIAEALEAAHEQGIIHRDLKPANIKVRDDGTVKVLDFGLAKMLDPVRADGTGQRAELTASPTITTPAMMTGIGMILGTAAYMSPEQARGRPTDRRADIWAFGVVLYEMLTGRRAFEGDDISITMAGVLKTEPDWSVLPADTPPALRRLLIRCLTKDPRERLQSIGDARFDLDEARHPQTSQVSVAAAPASRGRERMAMRIALAVVSLVAAVFAVRAFRPVASAPELRLEINTPPTQSPTSLAISPDGQQVVFVAALEGPSRLWLRSLNAVAPRAVPGTEGASLPFWSPDGRSIGFFADLKLKRIDVDGGAVRVLASTSIPQGGTWNRDGVIVFTPQGDSAAFRVSANGGEPVAVTHLGPSQQNHRVPRFLPDGRHFLYYVATGSPELRGVYVGQLDSPETSRLVDADAGAEYQASGYLLFVRQATLFAQRFDPSRVQLSGDPFPVAEQIALVPNATAAVSTAAAGAVVYRTSAGGGSRQFASFDRMGKPIGLVGGVHDANYVSGSPDGRYVAVSRTVNGNPDIWLFEIERGIFSRFTSDTASEYFPVWSGDGKSVAFNSNRGGPFNLYRKAAGGAGAEELLLATPLGKIPFDSSTDGRFLLYSVIDLKRGRDIWALPMEGTRKPFPVTQGEGDETNAQFSPDGNWVAYESSATGRFEIYAQPFPGPGAKVQISTAGGGQVRWRRDGKEIFYIGLDGRMMAVPIDLAATGQALAVKSPVPLFATRVGPVVTNNRQQYIVSPDGQQFLMNTTTEENAPIVVMLNWKPKPFRAIP